MAYNYVHQQRDRNNQNRSNGQRNAGQQNQQQNRPNYCNPDGSFHADGVYNQDQYDGKFSFDTIHGLKLKEVSYDIPSGDERRRLRNEFNGEVDPTTGEVIQEGFRSKFLKQLVTTKEALLVERLGLTPEDLQGMREGYCPKGFNVHHMHPLHGGGKNEASNLVLTPLYPHDQFHKDVLDPQLEGLKAGDRPRTVKIPYTDEMIYNPREYGFKKDNQQVQPNYNSNLHAENYSEQYLPEHINPERRGRQLRGFYQSIEERRQQMAQQREAAAAGNIAAAIRNNSAGR